MSDETPIERLELLIKMMGMTTSDNDAQALVALRKANDHIAKLKITWEQILRGKVKIIEDPFRSAGNFATATRSHVPPPPATPRPRPTPPPGTFHASGAAGYNPQPSAPPHFHSRPSTAKTRTHQKPQPTTRFQWTPSPTGAKVKINPSAKDAANVKDLA